MDNILIAFESLNHMKNNRIGKQGYMAFKLDMSKRMIGRVVFS